MVWSSVKSLKGASGVVLDLLRLLCSLVVLVAHSQAVWFPEHLNDLLPSHLSHGAVVIFFVLSGYVIAYTTVNGHRSPFEYAVARLTRLCSVYFPAIAVTIFCALAAYFINPTVYADYDRGNNVSRYLISLIYCNEIWFLSAAPIINGPIWSLGYEFWYYALFGVAVYRFKGWKGWILPLGIALFAGPKILLMMLIWVMGWAVFHLKKPVLNITLCWVLVGFFLSISILLMVILPSLPFHVGDSPLYWGAAFITDWIVGIVVALAIWLLPADIEPPLKDTRVLKKIRVIANLTFPIYVLHFPMLVVMKCLLPPTLNPAFCWLAGGLSTLVICIFLGLLFEAYKHKWKDFFTWLLAWIFGLFNSSKDALPVMKK